MNVKTKIKIGADEFEISQDVADQTEFFKFSAFFSSIPKVGPKGETDLKLVHRTPQGYNYFSLVSEIAQQEYKFGQSKENPGTLFGKGWEPLYQKTEGNATQSPIGATTTPAPVATTNASPIGAQPTSVQAPVTAAAVQAATPVQAAPTPVVVPQAAPAAAPAQKSNTANDVLARFGIQTK